MAFSFPEFFRLCPFLKCRCGRLCYLWGKEFHLEKFTLSAIDLVSTTGHAFLVKNRLRLYKADNYIIHQDIPLEETTEDETTEEVELKPDIEKGATRESISMISVNPFGTKLQKEKP